MEEKDWMELAGQKNQLAKVMESNRYGEQFGLSLTEEEAKQLMQERERCLKEQHRVEFGESILPRLIQAFCDSDYIRGRITPRCWEGCRKSSTCLRMNPWIC